MMQKENRNEWMTAYKLMKLGKDGNVYPLFINKKEATRFGEVLKAKCYPTKGFKIREGYHACFVPYAPHLKEELASGEKRVWVEIKVKNWKSYQRPASQGNAWILAQNIIAVRILQQKEVNELLNVS